MSRSVIQAAAGLLLVLAFAVTGARGATAPGIFTVEGVLSPAWVERAGGQRDPLTVGMLLGNRDRILTGPGARALIRMSEGSAVKLGENGVLALDQLQTKAGAAGEIVSASLDVVRGAFRFTTGLLGKGKAERDVNVRVNAVTAGIRGTDVWGKSESHRDVVCLIEGRISVTHGPRSFTMAEPLSFYIAPRQGEPLPIAPVTPQQIEVWQEETEIRAGRGGTRRGAGRAVLISQFDDERSAQAEQQKLRAAGYPASVARVEDATTRRFDVRIESVPDIPEATALAEKLRVLGFEQAAPAL